MTKGLLKSSQKCERLYKKAIKLNKNDEAYKEYITYRNSLNKLRRLTKSNYYASLLEVSKNDIKNTWKIMKLAMNKNIEQTSAPTSLKLNNKIIDNHKEIADVFCEFFTNVGPEYARKIPDPIKPYTSYLKQKNQYSIFLAPTDPEEISKIISKLKAKNSSGHDQINSKLLKHIQHEIKDPLSIMINKSISSGIFPDILKLAEVIPIHKSKDKQDIQNYRPISLLPTISKILEKVVHKRIYNFINKHNLLNKSQYGFRPRHSTIDAITEYMAHLVDNLENREHTLSIYLDLSKAFDTIDHSILLNKLEYYGIRGISHNWLTSYLTHITQYVKINQSTSKTKPIICGVPQGSVLGPLLFILYSNDLSNASRNSNAIIFADDTSIFTHDSNIDNLYSKINDDLLTLTDWFRANKLSLNISKTNYMLFTHTATQPATQPHLHTNHVRINNTDIYKKKH